MSFWHRCTAPRCTAPQHSIDAPSHPRHSTAAHLCEAAQTCGTRPEEGGRRGDAWSMVWVGARHHKRRTVMSRHGDVGPSCRAARRHGVTAPPFFVDHCTALHGGDGASLSANLRTLTSRLTLTSNHSLHHPASPSCPPSPTPWPGPHGAGISYDFPFSLTSCFATYSGPSGASPGPRKTDFAGNMINQPGVKSHFCVQQLQSRPDFGSSRRADSQSGLRFPPREKRHFRCFALHWFKSPMGATACGNLEWPPWGSREAPPKPDGTRKHS